MMQAITVALSTVKDGEMSASVDEKQRRINRRDFLRNHGIAIDQTVLVYLTYGGEDYARYHTVSAELGGDGMVASSSLEADALFTTNLDVALFLPVADCVAAVLYDPAQRVLGVSHLGRHNLLQDGGRRSIEYMVERFGTDPNAVSVWLSPAAGKANYPLFDFENKSLHEVTVRQLVSAGVRQMNIEIDDRDTTSDPRLFSHSEFLKGRQATDGRQAVVAMMRP